MEPTRTHRRGIRRADDDRHRAGVRALGCGVLAGGDVEMKFDTTDQLTGRVKATRETPAPASNAVSIFLVPWWAGVAVFVALFLFVGGILVCVKFPLLGVPSMGMGLVMLWALFWWLPHQPAFMWIRERVSQRDINQDGYIGAPPQVTAFELHEQGGGIKIGQLRVEPELVRDWCLAAVNGESLSFAAWSNRFALPDGTQGRERYTEFRNLLVGRGFVKDRGSQGLRVDWQNTDAVTFVSQFSEIDVSEGVPMIEGGS